MEVITQYAVIAALENQTPDKSKVWITISGVNFCIFLLFKLQVQLDKCMEAHSSNQCSNQSNPWYMLGILAAFRGMQFKKGVDH